jgi:hypothetical protein
MIQEPTLDRSSARPPLTARVRMSAVIAEAA